VVASGLALFASACGSTGTPDVAAQLDETTGASVAAVEKSAAPAAGDTPQSSPAETTPVNRSALADSESASAAIPAPPIGSADGATQSSPGLVRPDASLNAEEAAAAAAPTQTEGTDTAATSADTTAVVSPSSTVAPATTAPPATTAAPATTQPPTTAAPATQPATTQAPATTAPAVSVANDFPTGAAKNISTGENLRLNETLAGGSTPVLFWLWQPF